MIDFRYLCGIIIYMSVTVILLISCLFSVVIQTRASLIPSVMY